MIDTLSVIIPTTGRPSLLVTLESLRNQDWISGDEIILAYDGVVPPDFYSSISSFSGLPIKVRGVDDGPHYDWGHTPRNKVMPTVEAKWLCHIDDDDIYVDGAISMIRSTVSGTSAPHMFRMVNKNGTEVWRVQGALVFGNVATPCIVHPRMDSYPYWISKVGGDCDFISAILRAYPPFSVLWHETVIARVS